MAPSGTLVYPAPKGDRRRCLPGVLGPRLRVQGLLLEVHLGHPLQLPELLHESPHRGLHSALGHNLRSFVERGSSNSLRLDSAFRAGHFLPIFNSDQLFDSPQARTYRQRCKGRGPHIPRIYFSGLTESPKRSLHQIRLELLFPGQLKGNHQFKHGTAYSPLSTTVAEMW